MGKKISVLGCDPAFANFGIVYAEVDIENLDIQVQRMHLVQTTKTKNKQIRKSSDDIKRARELHKAFNDATDSKAIVFSEIPSGTQSATASWGLGIAVGVLASCPIPIVQLTPNEVKIRTAGKNASKREMIDWAVAQHPDAGWLTRKYKGEIELLNSNEHLADAIAVIHCGIESDQFLQMVELYKHAAAS
jgi:Holliday junction resolvasome RuvABC endonuclease subunit